MSRAREAVDLGAESLGGPSAAERLRRHYPGRAAELTALGGRLATDDDDDPLHDAVESWRVQLAAYERLALPDALIERARRGVAEAEAHATAHPMAPERVYAYPHHAARWPGYVREARLHFIALAAIVLDAQMDPVALPLPAIERGENDGAAYAAALPPGDDPASSDPALALAHAAFCVLDWVTQRTQRTDQDDIADILFPRWRIARFGTPTVAISRAYCGSGG